MKINNSVSFLLVIIAGIIIPAKSLAQSDYEKQTAAFSVDLAKKIKESNKTKVAVSDFLDNDGNTTELGKAIAEDISVGIVNEGKGAFQVMERSNLNAILKEQKLASTGLIDPETVKQLGRLKMVDAVIVGNITPFGNSFRVTIKILDTETGMSIAATSGNLSGTEDIKGLFIKKIILGNVPSEKLSVKQQDTNTAPNKQDDVTASRDIDGCNDADGSIANGDYCFVNKTSFDLVIIAQYYKNFQLYDVLNIKPNETKCVYSVWVKQADFYRNKFYAIKKENYKPNTRIEEMDTYDSGTFQTIKCKTTTYTIK